MLFVMFVTEENMELRQKLDSKETLFITKIKETPNFTHVTCKHSKDNVLRTVVSNYINRFHNFNCLDCKNKIEINKNIYVCENSNPCVLCVACAQIRDSNKVNYRCLVFCMFFFIHLFFFFLFFLIFFFCVFDFFLD